MDVNFYISRVQRNLNIPPWYAVRELRELKREFKSCQAEGMTDTKIKEKLGEPEEAAALIQTRYPTYHNNPLCMAPLVLACVSLFGLFIELRDKFYHLMGASTRHELILSGEMPLYTIYNEAGQGPSNGPFLSAPGYDPEDVMFFCALGLVIGIYFYFFFRYTPDN